MGKKSKIMQLIDCPRTKVRELPCITKENYFMDNIEKLVSVLRYMNETLFKKMCGRTAYLVRLLVYISAVKALVHF
jgi:hypothetical protein